MPTGDCNDSVRNGKEDSVELDDGMKSYSSSWVSTRRECKTKAGSDNNKNGKVNVMPSKACNNLHSLLENEDKTSDINISDKTSSQVLLTLAKSDCVLNPHKMFGKGDSPPLIRLPDKTIDSTSKSESNSPFEHTQVGDALFQDDLDKDKRTSEQFSNQSLLVQEHDEQMDDLLAMLNYSESVVESHKDENNENTKNQTHLEIQENKIKKIPQQDSEGGNPSDILKTTKNKNFSNGKLVAEMNVTSLILTDPESDYFPVTIKYVWETDASDILNFSSNIYETSKTFIETIETLSAFGMEPTGNIKRESKDNKCFNPQNCQRNKEKSTSGGFTKKRQDIDIDDKQHEKATSELAENKNSLCRGAKSKTRIRRSRLSITSPLLNRKGIVSPEDQNYEIKNEDGCKYTSFTKNYSRPAALGGGRSRCRIETRTTSEIVGKTFRYSNKNISEEVKQPSSAQGISSVFKKHSSLGLSQRKPPSAPTRESPIRSSGKIAVNEEDKLTGFAHKSIGFNKSLNHLSTTGRNFPWK